MIPEELIKKSAELKVDWYILSVYYPTYAALKLQITVFKLHPQGNLRSNVFRV